MTFSVIQLITTLILNGYIQNFANAIPSDILNHKDVFGPVVGITVNETGKVDRVMAGTWRSILTNDTIANGNENITQYNQSSGAFKAAIEMIKPDGTFRHTHALTDFVVNNITQNIDNKPTIFTGTSTISLRGGPAVDIPIVIQRSGDGNLFIIKIDPESVDYHFGKSPLIYGISANP